MKIILFGTVIRTRKRLSEILIKAVKEGKTNSDAFKWGLSIYNTGLFGFVFYRTIGRFKDENFFIEQSKK